MEKGIDLDLGKSIKVMMTGMNDRIPITEL